MNAQTLPPSASHFIGMMNMHYAAADFFAAQSERYQFPSKAHEKCLKDAQDALALAEQARISARELGAKV